MKNYQQKKLCGSENRITNKKKENGEIAVKTKAGDGKNNC